jgi:hypothetical protein
MFRFQAPALVMFPLLNGGTRCRKPGTATRQRPSFTTGAATTRRKPPAVLPIRTGLMQQKSRVCSELYFWCVIDELCTRE